MERRVTRSKAIRQKCLDCCCGSNVEVRLCPVIKCPLWRYRLGNEKRAITVDFEERPSMEYPLSI